MSRRSGPLIGHKGLEVMMLDRENLIAQLCSNVGDCVMSSAWSAAHGAQGCSPDERAARIRAAALNTVRQGRAMIVGSGHVWQPQPAADALLRRAVCLALSAHEEGWQIENDQTALIEAYWAAKEAIEAAA